MYCWDFWKLYFPCTVSVPPSHLLMFVLVSVLHIKGRFYLGILSCSLTFIDVGLDCYQMWD